MPIFIELQLTLKYFPASPPPLLRAALRRLAAVGSLPAGSKMAARAGSRRPSPPSWRRSGGARAQPSAAHCQRPTHGPAISPATALDALLPACWQTRMHTFHHRPQLALDKWSLAASVLGQYRLAAEVCWLAIQSQGEGRVTT